MNKPAIGILHYSVAPVVGGVEAVIQAHARLFIENGYQVTLIAGQGDADSLPDGCDLVLIPEISTQHADILKVSQALEQGNVPPEFSRLRDQLVRLLKPVLNDMDYLIVHNIWTKHFNLPLTAALHQLLDAGVVRGCIAWCHDFTWTSPNSRSKVRPGYPWDLLRAYRSDVTFVAVSERRKRDLAGVLDCHTDVVRVVYNGIDPKILLGLTDDGYALITQLRLLESDLIILMPVRVTPAKNIEYAMRVVQALKLCGMQPRLVVTGPPDPHDSQSMAYFDGLKQMGKQLGIERHVSFVFDSGADPNVPLRLEPETVGDLFRVSDVMFMPSHREGFGMPILEAGLAGIPVVCSEVPAAEEIGLNDVIRFELADDPMCLAERIIDWTTSSPTHRLRHRVRQGYTWEALFRTAIEPQVSGQKEARHADTSAGK